MVASLIEYGRLRTTDEKAKELRRLVEPAISWATSVGDLLQKPEDKRQQEDKARIVHAMRMAGRVVRIPAALAKLFDEVAPRFIGRRGGYVRITKLGRRPGDAAAMSMVELIGVEAGQAD
jgi:large subunit ribosomal protein L17